MSVVPPTVDPPRPFTTVDTDAYFAPQPTSTSRLPDPRPLVENLAYSVVEVLSGAREIEQIARWLNAFSCWNGRRSARSKTASSSVGARGWRGPAEGVNAATVIMHGRARSRAIAIRLEGFDSRWRATALSVL